MEKTHNAQIQSKQLDIVDSNVTRADVQRHSRVSIEYHLKDFIESIRETQRYTHLIRIVINDYDESVRPFHQEPELREYFYKIHEEHPEVVFFLEKNSLKTFLEIVREAKLAHYDHPVGESVDLDTLKKELGHDNESMVEQMRQDAHVFFSNIMEGDPQIAVNLTDDFMERFKTAIGYVPPETSEDEK
jgi:hypothetical protein